MFPFVHEEFNRSNELSVFFDVTVRHCPLCVERGNRRSEKNLTDMWKSGTGRACPVVWRLTDDHRTRVRGPKTPAVPLVVRKPRSRLSARKVRFVTSSSVLFFSVFSFSTGYRPFTFVERAPRNRRLPSTGRRYTGVPKEHRRGRTRSSSYLLRRTNGVGGGRVMYKVLTTVWWVGRWKDEA